MSGRYFEDFAVGQTFGSGRVRISREQIKAFAAEFDPQPFHLNEEAAEETFFQGLATARRIQDKSRSPARRPKLPNDRHRVPRP